MTVWRWWWWLAVLWMLWTVHCSAEEEEEEPPFVVSITPPWLVVQEGGNASFHCEVDPHSVVGVDTDGNFTYSWFTTAVDLQPLSNQAGQSLALHNLHIGDSDNYICMVTRHVDPLQRVNGTARLKVFVEKSYAVDLTVILSIDLILLVLVVSTLIVRWQNRKQEQVLEQKILESTTVASVMPLPPIGPI